MEESLSKRESRSGSTFIGTYRQCPRRFYLRYVEGLIAERQSEALVFGQAWHSVKEAFYRKEPSPVDKGHEYLNAERASFKEEQGFLDAKRRLAVGWDAWRAAYEKEDKERYLVKGVEEPVEVVLPNGMVVTMRFDLRVVDQTTGLMWVVDSKTTGWGAGDMAKSLEQDDQMTAYIYAMHKLMLAPGQAIGGAMGDILSQKAYATKAEKRWTTTVDRRFIVRSKNDLRRWEAGVIGTFEELSQKVAAVKDGYPEDVLFPRHGGWCAHFPCEYVDFCRLHRKGEEMPGFVREPWEMPSSKE